MGILSGAEEDDEEALMQRALELSLRDMSTDENATYSTDRGDAMVTSDAGEEDEQLLGRRDSHVMSTILMGVLKLLFASLMKASIIRSLKINTEAINAMATSNKVPKKYKMTL